MRELSFDSYASPIVTSHRFSWSQEMQPTPSNLTFQGSTPVNGDMLRGSTLRKFNFYLHIDEQPVEEAATDKDLLQIADEELIFKNEAGNRIDA